MEGGVYRIDLDGQWSLRDFYDFPHTFEQLYAFHYAFDAAEDQVRDDEGLVHAFATYPWRGGYSAVNFYNTLGYQIPRQLRPQVRAIQYSSPGFIDLGVYVAVAMAVGKAVKIFVDSGERLNALYTTIHKDLQQRKLLRIEAKRSELGLADDELKFIEQSSDRIARLMGFKDLQALHGFTGNPLASLKILLSYYRRARTLATFQEEGKLSLPTDSLPSTGGPTNDRPTRKISFEDVDGDEDDKD
jgi:hypothetical protein